MTNGLGSGTYGADVDEATLELPGSGAAVLGPAGPKGEAGPIGPQANDLGFVMIVH